MTSLATSLRSLPKRQAGGPNGAVTDDLGTARHVLGRHRLAATGLGCSACAGGVILLLNSRYLYG